MKLGKDYKDELETQEKGCSGKMPNCGNWLHVRIQFRKIGGIKIALRFEEKLIAIGSQVLLIFIIFNLPSPP